MLEAIVIALSFILGKTFSLILYQICWQSNQHGYFKTWGSSLLWLPVILASRVLPFIDWQGLPLTRIFASVCVLQLAFAAVGRFNPSRLHKQGTASLHKQGVA